MLRMKCFGLHQNYWLSISPPIIQDKWKNKTLYYLHIILNEDNNKKKTAKYLLQRDILEYS